MRTDSKKKFVFKKFTSILSNPSALFFIGLVLVVGLTFPEVIRGRGNNFKIFSQATQLFWQGIAPFGENWTKMAPGLDKFLYGPIFNFFFAPFAFLPKSIGPFLWNIFSYSLYFLSVFTLPGRFSNKQKRNFFLYTFLILAATLFAFQTNALVAALFLFSFTLLEKGKSFWAIVLILFSGFIKVYGIFQLGLLLCYPRFWRNMLYVIPTCLFFLLIPALNGKIGNLLSYYHTWIDVIMGHGENRLWHTFFYMQPWQNISHWSVWIQAGTLAVLAAMFIACYKKFGSFSFRVQVTGILMTWIVLFSNAADTHTYLISMAGYMLWYHSREQHETTDRILYFALLIVVMVVQIDVLCPTTIKHFLYRKLSLHLWLVFINLLRMCRITFVKSIADEYFSAMTIVRK